MCGPAVTGGYGSFDGNNGGTFGGPAPAPAAQQQAAAPAPQPANPTFSTQSMGGAQQTAPAFQLAAQQPAAPPSNVSGTFSQFGPRPGGSGRVVN